MNRQQLVEQARQAALKELQARKNAREHLIDFTTYTKQDYHVGAHHRLLCEKLEAVERGDIKRLMVFMPPRHGKSELASTRFPAWYIGRNPTRQIITASYSAKLADKFGRDVRNIISSQLYSNIFTDVALAPDSKAKDLWNTTKGGVFLAAGVGGSMTGYGGHLAIIDDPVKDRQDAESETIRENIWDWYKSVLRTRIMPGGAIIIVQTRWHVDDLSGRLINEMENGTGEEWDIINLPAIATSDDDALNRKIGEPLWSEAYGIDALDAIKISVGERDWASLYQGSPIISSGTFFKIQQIPIIDAAPKASKIVRRWDFAATKETGKYDPDWSVGVKMQRNIDNSYTIIDIVRFRGTPDEVEAAVLATASRDGRNVQIVYPQDPGQAGVAQATYYAKLLSGYRFEAVRETGDKATRANPFASQVNIGNVSLLRAPWNNSFIEELQCFPSGAHDDQVDAASGAFEMIAITLKPQTIIFNKSDLKKIRMY
ncbi:Phage terminase large subunit [Commensalibacter communis]|uniref:Phage terminase large subunit n=1 Tax=Commensalibacter communis TaxID=2972786 RepID=A0A9W4XAQ4_9PROT|nr:phage terminase large subunit [Commensalibacter communis]CAI3941945.1 Phage terminase large subunit [Commensalibacter communis]CAI3944679.1 Phage terminase large subunit [Commensalibacter communis]CAI3958892.1 Phage terminase large subunit [Commensalibacter communis]CAI3961138.1 Phage terminase large subunit [Commensalibacter communis]